MTGGFEAVWFYSEVGKCQFLRGGIAVSKYYMLRRVNSPLGPAGYAFTYLKADDVGSTGVIGGLGNSTADSFFRKVVSKGKPLVFL